MRALAVVGLGAIVATAGACIALSGIGDYLACTDNCDDATQPPHDASVLDVQLPPGDSRLTPDVKVPVDMGTTPVPEASPDDAGPGDVIVPPMDAGDARPPDAGSDADAGKPAEAGPPPGPTCGPRGTTTRCTGTQLCCPNLAALTNACASSCDAGGPIGCSVPSDCPASKPMCCATMTMTGGLPPCTVTAFSSSCATTCADLPPGGCIFSGTVRLCAHDSDCSMDTAYPACFNFQNAPTSWCTTVTQGTTPGAGGVEQK